MGFRLILLFAVISFVYCRPDLTEAAQKAQDAAKETAGKVGDAVGDAWDASRDWLKDLSDEAVKSWDSAKEFFSAKIKDAKDYYEAKSNEEIRKKIAITETYLKKVKEDSDNLKKNATKEQKASLDKVDAKLVKVQEAKKKVDESDDLEANKETLRGLSDELWEDEFIENVTAVTGASSSVKAMGATVLFALIFAMVFK